MKMTGGKYSTEIVIEMGDKRLDIEKVSTAATSKFRKNVAKPRGKQRR